MNKSAFARELGSRLGLRMTRQMAGKYHARGMPGDSVDSALEWLAMNSVGEPGRRAGDLMKRRGTQGATLQPSGATLQPDDDCGALKPDPFLTVEDGASFYEPKHDDDTIVMLSGLLQERVPKLTRCSPALAAAIARAIREVVCDFTGGECCPRCRRTVGIVDPPEPDKALVEAAA